MDPRHDPTLRRRRKSPRTCPQEGPKAARNLLCAGWDAQQQGDTCVWGGGEPKASYTLYNHLLHRGQTLPGTPPWGSGYPGAEPIPCSSVAQGELGVASFNFIKGIRIFR